jgi:PIN domain nuclease of toxin-antitoxin system
LIRLDTHAALWVYTNRLDELTAGGRRLLDGAVFISPIVELELTVLYELGRLGGDGTEVMRSLVESIGAQTSPATLSAVVHAAQSLDWTRDPFDRLIVADAIATNCQLLTVDATIREHCDLAVW